MHLVMPGLRAALYESAELVTIYLEKMTTRGINKTKIESKKSRGKIVLNIDKREKKESGRGNSVSILSSRGSEETVVICSSSDTKPQFGVTHVTKEALDLLSKMKLANPSLHSQAKHQRT